MKINKNNWEIKKLGDACQIINGGTPKSDEKKYWGGDVLWVTPKDLGQLKSRYIDDTPRKITKLGLVKSSAKLFPANSVILSTRAPIGHLAINLKDMSTNQGCRGIVPNKNVDVNYLYYFLKKSKKKLNELGTGATFKELSRNVLANVMLPLPPLPKQKRIVAILDEAFDSITKVKENAEKNLANTKELFESYLNNVFTNPSDDWEKKKLEDIAEIKGGKRVPKGYKLETQKTKYPYIRVKDFNDNGSIDLNDIHYLNEEVYKQIKNYTISSNDLYISIAGTIGKTGIIPKELDNANLTENACKLVFKKEINNKFVYYITKTKSFLIQSGLNTRVAAMPKLALTRLSTIKINIPKLSKQKYIVTKLDELLAETNRLEEIYKKKITTLDELKQSILNKVFNGELKLKL